MTEAPVKPRGIVGMGSGHIVYGYPIQILKAGRGFQVKVYDEVQPYLFPNLFLAARCAFGVADGIDRLSDRIDAGLLGNFPDPEKEVKGESC